MRSKPIDIDEGNDFSEAAFKKRFRRVNIDELPEPVRKRREAAIRKLKQRVTIYFDSEIVTCFKELSKDNGVGYQTLMNEALRRIITGASAEDVKENLLKDKKFLKRLKTALSA